MPSTSAAHCQTLDCAGVGVALTADDRALIDFVIEYFDPWFRPKQRAAEWLVSVSTAPSVYAEMQAGLPADAQPQPCFAHDQQVLSMPAWRAGGVVNVCDSERSCFLRLRPGHVELIAGPRTRRWRFTLLWIVQEIAATRLRQTHVDMHAAAVESAGRAHSIVILCIHGIGHLRAVLPVVAALCRRGWTVHVLSHAEFRVEVEHAGARFVDLFGRYPLEAADATSRPVPSCYVSFAGVYAERLAQAREWELRTIAGRDAVIDRILALTVRRSRGG